MKKVMLLAAMLAMVLAAAVPALAQSVTQVGEGNIACVQTAVQQQVGNTQVAASQSGDATNFNVQNISQECNISVNEAETAVKYLPVKKYMPVKKYASATATASATAAPVVQYKYYKSAAPAVQYEYSASPTASASSASYSAAASASSAAAAELPSTGGSSLIALGAGVLLVAGGLLARRIVR